MKKKKSLSNESFCFQQVSWKMETDTLMFTGWKYAPLPWFKGGNRGAPKQCALCGLRMIGPNRPKLILIILVVFSNCSVFSRESILSLPSCAEQSLDMSAHVNLVNILTQLVIYLCVTFLRFNRRREIRTHAHVHASTCTDTVTGGVCILQYVCAACVYEFTRVCAWLCMFPYTDVWSQVG